MLVMVGVLLIVGVLLMVGVLDMVGNVWQWTDEYADEHTRPRLSVGGATINR